MKRYKTIAGQLAFTYTTSILNFVFSLLFFAVLTRSLSKAEFGVVSLFFITIMLIGPALALGLPNYFIAKVARFKKGARLKTLNTIFSFQLLFIAAFLVIALIVSVPLINGFMEYKLLLILTILIISTVPFIHILHGYIYGKQMIKTAHFITFLDNIWLIIVPISVGVLGYLTLHTVFYARFIVVLLTLFGVIYYLRKKDGLSLVKPDMRILRNALAFSVPLVPLFISEHLINAGDRYIIAMYSGAAATGAYAFFYSLLLIILNFAAMPNEIFFSYSSKEYKRNREKSNFFFNASAKYCLMLLIPALIGFFMLKEEIVTLISGPKYLSDLYVLPFLILYPLFQYFSVFYHKVALLKEKTKYLAGTYIFSGIFNIVLNLILVPRFGIVGAAVATIITYAVLFGLLFIEGRSFITWNYSFLQLHKIVLAGAVMGFVLYFFHPVDVVSKVLTMGLGAIVYFVSLFLLKSFVKKEIKLLKSILLRR